MSKMRYWVASIVVTTVTISTHGTLRRRRLHPKLKVLRIFTWFYSIFPLKTVWIWSKNPKTVSKVFCWSSAPCVALICRHQQAHSGYPAPQRSPIPTPVTNNPLWSAARLPSCPLSLISVPAVPRPPSCYLPENLPADLRYLLSSAANWSFVLSVLFCVCVCISQKSEKWAHSKI